MGVAHLELARASRAVGDTAAARDHYDTFLAMWRDGDPLPILQTAAAERRDCASPST